MTVAWVAFVTLSVLGAATFFAAGLVLTRGRAAADGARRATRVTRFEHELAASLASGGLDGLVRQLSSDPRFGAAVISDELGLLVAGGGERAEELAALGGYLAGVGDRASQLADLGAPTRIVVEDDRNATLTAVHLPGGSLIAITISRRARPA